MCLNFSFEFEVFLIFTMQILINGFRCFVAVTQNEPFDTVIAHGNNVIANIFDMSFNLLTQNK